MTPLQQQAKAFLDRPIPAELKPHYVPDSLADRLLAYYAKHGKLDPEGQELAGLCVMELESALDQHETPEAQAYFRDCRNLLSAMVDAAS